VTLGADPEGIERWYRAEPRKGSRRSIARFLRIVDIPRAGGHGRLAGSGVRLNAGAQAMGPRVRRSERRDVLSMRLAAPRPVTSTPLEQKRRPLGRPSEGELLLEVVACGVCRTDLQLAEGQLAARRLPIVPGHQVVGRVGRSVTGFMDGSRGSGLGRSGLGRRVVTAPSAATIARISVATRVSPAGISMVDSRATSWSPPTSLCGFQQHSTTSGQHRCSAAARSRSCADPPRCAALSAD
jgi:uncharacterized protein YbaR (Trm112 family)